MDELAFHPYPQPQQGPPSTRYAWPTAGLANLDRIKQAVWDAFHGTAQPTFAEAGTTQPKPLRFDLDEVGWQVAPLPAVASLYTGVETAGTKLISEDDQATYYRDTVTLAECDPGVRMLSFFHLVDETDLDRWQSGLERADGSHRPSYDAVKQTLAQTHGNCPTDAGRLAAPDRRRAADRGVGEPQAAAAEAQPLELQRGRGRGGGLPGRALQGGAVEGGARQAPRGRPPEAAAPGPRRDQGEHAARVLSAAPAEARPLRLCDPDDRHHEPEPRERPRQPAVPGRRPANDRPARRAARRARRQLLARPRAGQGAAHRRAARGRAAGGRGLPRRARRRGAPVRRPPARAAARAAARRGQRRAARLRLADRARPSSSSSTRS